MEIGWQSPVAGPVHPQFVPIMEPSGLGWLDGFDELMVRCGLESNGAPEFDERGRLTFPLHGKIANLPARQVEVSVDPATGEICVRGVVEESRFHFQKLRLTSTIVTKVGATGWRWEDEITNLSATPAEAQLLYHFNVGLPLLDVGSEVVAPVKDVVARTRREAEAISSWHRIAAAQPGFAEQVYFFDLLANAQGRTRVLLKNSRATQGVSLQFVTRQLPCFTLWKNTASEADGYVIGLEPGTNYPNPRSYEAQQGRIVKLAPGQTARFELEVDVHSDAQSVANARQAVDAIQAGTQPRIHDQPQPGWCPAGEA
jgi:hypothetical protein